MSRSSRRMRRARRRKLLPMLREIAPGVYDVALPIPPGMPPDEVQAMVDHFRQVVRDELGLELHAPHVCTPNTCSHARPDAGADT